MGKGQHAISISDTIQPKRDQTTSFAIVSPSYPPDHCGVGDHTSMLAATLAADGARVNVYTTRGAPRSTPPRVHVHPVVPHWQAVSMWTLASTITRTRPNVVLIQYVPFLYARHVGFAASFLALFLRLRGIAVVTIVHEPYVPLELNVKRFILSVAQRVMLVMLMLSSRRVAVTTMMLAHQLRRLLPWFGERVHRVPVGSNIVMHRIDQSERRALRGALGVAPDGAVLVFFGSLHETKLLGLILRTFVYLRESGVAATLLIVGQDQATFSAAAAKAGLTVPAEVICTGYATTEEVSHYLQCGDLMLAPFMDGVSTRRTTVVAALQHGLPVVSTEGRCTERPIFAGAVSMTPCHDEEGYVRAAHRLAHDPIARRGLSEQGRQLAEQRFSWPAIARSLIDEPTRGSEVKVS